MDQSTTSEMEKEEEQENVQQVDDEEKQAVDATASNRNHGRCFAWMTHHHLGWLARVPEQWPRSCSLVFGVVRLIGLASRTVSNTFVTQPVLYYFFAFR
jgi:hypothetical protein